MHNNQGDKEGSDSTQPIAVRVPTFFKAIKSLQPWMIFPTIRMPITTFIRGGALRTQMQTHILPFCISEMNEVTTRLSQYRIGSSTEPDSDSRKKKPSFRGSKLSTLRVICICLHTLLVLVHLALVIVWSYHFEHGIVVSLSRSAIISTTIIVASQFFISVRARRIHAILAIR
jgi:hypothetical protein